MSEQFWSNSGGMSLSIRHWLAERHIEPAQLGQGSTQIAGIAFRLAQDMEVKSLNPFAISALTDVLQLPLKAAWEMAPVISQLTVGLLRILSRKKPLRRNEGTWLTFQIAYLNALQGILEQESELRRPWVNRGEIPASLDTNQPLNNPQLIALLKTLRPGRLTDSQAEQALSLVADSLLVQQMNNLAIAWFVANGAEETEAKLLTQRLSNGLSGHLLTVIAENPLPLAQLQKFFRLGNLSRWRDPTTEENPELEPEILPADLPLNLHREYYRAELMRTLSDPLLAEPFSLKDLYIPLKGRSLPGETESREESSPFPVDLMEWVMSQLKDKTRISVIEADPGGGKTSFCQMLASRVAGELYPQWMPILIRLRDASLGQTLEQTLESAFPLGRFTDNDGWFSLNSPPCLLLLDGLNELPRSSQTERHLWSFLDQVRRFHTQDLGTTGRPRHKILLTSRCNTLDSLQKKYRQSGTLTLTSYLRRIVIEPMGQNEFRLWFNAWAKLQSKTIAQTYFSFLKHGGVFQQNSAVKELAALVTRPLMLFLMGILHRDALLDESIFQMELAQIKFEIYDRICRWLLGQPAGSGPLPELIREGQAHARRSQEAIANLLNGRHPQELRYQMQVAALTILHTGQHQVSQTAIQKRLTSEPTPNVPLVALPALFFQSQSSKGLKIDRLKEELNVEMFKVESLKKQQLAFNRKPVNPTPSPPTIEFSHPSLGEYLAAEEIATQLTALTRQFQDQYGKVSFVIHDAVNVAQHLYSLLGYGLLSVEIEELVIERLRREEKRNPDNFSFPILFKRLYRFYQAYCRCQWLDEGIAHQAHSKLQALYNPLNVLQVDAAVGLNVFLLLCSGAREAQIPFWPCGNPDIPREFNNDQLLSFISRSAALSPSAFWQRVRQSLGKVQLAGACLNQAMLAEANLWEANLSAAQLIGVNLAAANLPHADLSGASLVDANLSNANLFGAKLEGADLSWANLKGANLKSANLSNACLFEAQLDEQHKSLVIKTGAIFSLEEFRFYNQSLLPTKIFGLLEEDGLLEEEPTIFIESAEGEPMLPDKPYRPKSYDYDDDDDGETAQIEESKQQQLDVYDDNYDTNPHEETMMLSDSTEYDIDAQIDSI